MNKYQNYINGKWIDSSSKETLQVEDPSNTKIIGEVALAKNEEVELAVDAAKKAFEKRILADMSLIERSRLMRKIANELRKVANEGGNLISHENGKPLAGAIKEFNDTAEMFEYYAGLTDKLEGRTIPVANGIFDYTILEPYGVSAQIIPWNYPISMIGRSLSCAVATGNSSVIKTSELTPLSAAHSLAKAFNNAGVPPGIINIICGYGNEAGAQLVSHPDVKHIVFTGSVATGKKILHAAADKAIPAIVELGGKSAGIVFPDANIDKVVESAKYGIFSNAGQICTAMSRLVVHKSIKEEVVKKLSDLTKSMKMGAGYEEGVEFTPVVSEKQLEKVEGYARSGVQAGAEAVVGGKRADREGYFMEPTILNNVTRDMTVAREEIFGPVLSILEYEEPEEAIEIANDTEYGLAAGCFTEDLNQATWASNKLEAGSIYVNKWFAGGITSTPFGGYKQSGYSREKGQQALNAYLQIKNVGISLG